jgi:SAM-dependent methyltransferase
MGHAQLTRVDPTNLEQARAWDGDEGAYWARHANLFETALRRYQPTFLDAAAIGATDTVLDIGCGTGATTRDAARRATDGTALGVDLSADMIAVARERAAAEGLGNARFEQADAQIHPFEPGGFDLALSRTGTMFFGDLHAAFANIARALRPGGRFVQLVWQALPENEWIATFGPILAAGRDLPPPPPEAPGPFTLSDPARLRELLTGTGFTEPEVVGLREPMWFGADADEATAFIGGLMAWMLADLDEARRRQVWDDLHAVMAAHQGPDGVELGSAAWLVSAVRRT